VVTNASSPITLDAGETLEIYAVANSGYYFETNQEDQWSFTNEA